MWGLMVKLVCVFCLGPVWKYPVQELPGGFEEERQGGTKAAGSTKQLIYRYLLSPRLIYIFNLSAMTNTPHLASPGPAIVLTDGRRGHVGIKPVDQPADSVAPPPSPDRESEV